LFCGAARISAKVGHRSPPPPKQTRLPHCKWHPARPHHLDAALAHAVWCEYEGVNMGCEYTPQPRDSHVCTPNCMYMMGSCLCPCNGLMQWSLCIAHWAYTLSPCPTHEKSAKFRNTRLVNVWDTSLVDAGQPPLHYEARKPPFTSLVKADLALRASYRPTSLVYEDWLVTSLATRLVCPPV
jgi:hypothetical protein